MDPPVYRPTQKAVLRMPFLPDELREPFTDASVLSGRYWDYVGWGDVLGRLAVSWTTQQLSQVVYPI